MAETLIKNFKQISKADTEIAGGKGASLGEMTQAGIPVPEGFVILSNAFDRFLEETDLNVEIDAALDEVDIKEIHTVENASEKIQAMILSREMPGDIKSEILDFYKKLDCKFVAVRSSATSEDSASAAWAGQLDSFLNTTKETLLENVKKCWASLFTPRAIFYRFEKKLNKDKISVAVVVQKMVDSEESGIAFSVHPVTQDENQIIIEAGFGLGEAIVSGSITPDSYVVDKQRFSILDINVNKQTKALYKKANGGNEWRELEGKGKKQVLAKKEIIELSKLIVKIENHYGFPCDIEWAKERGKFYIVQSRPITTITKNNTIKKISLNDYIIPRKRNNLPVCLNSWNAKIETSPQIKKNFGKALRDMILYYNMKGDTRPLIVRKDWIQLGEFIANKIINSKDYYAKIQQKTLEAKKDCLDFINNFDHKTLLEEKEIDFLINLATKTYKMFAKYDSANVSTWFVSGDILYAKAKGILQIDDEKLAVLSTPKELSYTSKMERDIYKFIIKKANIKKSAQNLSKKYYWITHGYDGKKVLDEKYFITELRKCKREGMAKTESKFNEIETNLKQTYTKQEKIIKNHNFSSKGLHIIEVLRNNNLWFDERKMIDFQLFYIYYLILKELSKRIKISKNDLCYLLIDELGLLQQNEQKAKEIILNRKNKEFVIKAKNGNFVNLTKKDKKIIELLKKNFGEENSVKIVKGFVASKGNRKASGIVSIIKSQKDVSKIKKGNILVSPMTTPDLIIAIKKAGAIITDEGGITCHAAIVSRELKIPCIIGTENATSILKDGDLVEVDANQGIVKILKKKK